MQGIEHWRFLNYIQLFSCVGSWFMFGPVSIIGMPQSVTFKRSNLLFYLRLIPIFSMDQCFEVNSWKKHSTPIDTSYPQTIYFGQSLEPRFFEPLKIRTVTFYYFQYKQETIQWRKASLSYNKLSKELFGWEQTNWYNSSEIHLACPGLFGIHSWISTLLMSIFPR